MLGRAPAFPAIDEWRSMSENEQDAFLARLEASRRRKQRLRAVFLSAAACAAIAASLYLAMPVGR